MRIYKEKGNWILEVPGEYGILRMTPTRHEVNLWKALCDTKGHDPEIRQESVYLNLN